MAAVSSRYDKPSRATRAANTTVRWLADCGIGFPGAQVLRVRGRRTGKRRAVVVNVLNVDGVQYVLSPRGDTQWARNVRAAGVVEIGPRWRSRRVPAAEVADAAKPDLMRRYLARWYWQVKGFVPVTPASADAELRAAAPSIPVFVLAGRQ